MKIDPFKYNGPLSPDTDRLVCDFREEEVRQILSGIFSSEYQAILGPRKSGKTTLLHLIRERQPEAYYIYKNLEEAIQLSEIDFYKELLNKLLIEVPMTGNAEISDKDWEEMGPSFVFLDFLRQIPPKDPSKKIVFLLDEVDRLPYRQSFLSMWRQVYHERYDINHLKSYSVVITGTMDLVLLTSDSPNSPFNIVETFFIEDFSQDQSHNLLQSVFTIKDIAIDENAMKRLIEWLGGHPQLLQHAGSILAKRAVYSNVLKDDDIESVLNELYKHNLCLNTLRKDVMTNEKLRNMLNSIIIEGKRRRFFRFRGTALYGVGAFVEHNGYCNIRNKLYEKVIREVLESQADEQDIATIQTGRNNV